MSPALLIHSSAYGGTKMWGIILLENEVNFSCLGKHDIL
jgi:hypothetical protein